jgi:hypothetical protein
MLMRSFPVDTPCVGKVIAWRQPSFGVRFENDLIFALIVFVVLVSSIIVGF